MPRTVTFLIILIGLVLSFGCSKDSGLPVIPADSNINAGIPVDDSSYQSDRNSFMGIYSMVIDTENLIAVIEPDRESMMHLNITSYLPAPTIVINSYDPSSGIVDVDFTIMNPYKLDAYDIRLIIYTDSYGHKLLNFDSWTGLFDIAGGLPINPFAAFAKDKPNRVFMQKASETVKYYCPEGIRMFDSRLRDRTHPIARNHTRSTVSLRPHFRMRSDQLRMLRLMYSTGRMIQPRSNCTRHRSPEPLWWISPAQDLIFGK
jgi:hypothetical protein